VAFRDPPSGSKNAIEPSVLVVLAAEVSGSVPGPAVTDEKTVVVKGWQPPTLQPAFQSTSTPVSLSARFMVIQLVLQLWLMLAGKATLP